MASRREFLCTGALAALGLALPPLAAAAPRPAGRFFLVNGWILTAGDVAALGIDIADAERPGQAAP